jgi:hypothetical protein
MKLTLKAAITQSITVEQNSKGSWYIRKEENGKTYILDPVKTPGWIPLDAFVHSADWAGCVFDTKEDANKALKLYKMRLQDLAR